MQELEAYHRLNPLRRGMPREELKSRLNLPARLFTLAARRLGATGSVLESGPLVMKPDHEVRFTPQQQQAVQGLTRRFAAAPFSPPAVKEAQAEVGEDVFAALLDLGVLVQVSSEVVFSKEGYERLVQGVKQLLSREGSLTAAQVPRSL